MKILVLGHRGMLGNAVYRYFSKTEHEVQTVPSRVRWVSWEMKRFIWDSDAEWIINCTGAIPQRTKNYFDINVRFPLFLFDSGKKIIHASTDCEFSGDLPLGQSYEFTREPDAVDDYGLSKVIPVQIARRFHMSNVYIIRTSIVGIEEDKGNASLLGWFLSSEGKIKGFSNHYWNGITTLEWAKLAESLVENRHPGLKFVQPTSILEGNGQYSKYDLLLAFREIFEKDIEIEKVESSYCNRTLQSNFFVKDIKLMLKELKDFYSL